MQGKDTCIETVPSARRQEVEWVGGFVLILVSEDLGYLGLEVNTW